MLDDGFYFVFPSKYSRFRATLTSWDEYPQNPITADDLSFTCDMDVPVPPLQEIVFVHDGVQLYHGVVYQCEDKKTYQAVKLKSMQWLLRWRAFQAVVYHGATLDQILSSDAPSPSVDIPGAFFRVNSEIPNGKWTAHSATVAKLVDGGLKSQMGAGTLYAYTTYPQATADACDGVVQLSDAGAVPTAANQFYRTTDDLYVRLGDGSYLPNAFIVAALDKFDTKIRYKSCDIGTYKNTVDFQLKGQADTEISNLMEKAGREVEFRPGDDGYVWFSAKAECSRGSEDAPIRKFVSGHEGCTITISSDAEPAYQAAISTPGDAADAPQAVASWKPNRVQLWKLYNTEAPTADVMRERLQDLMDGNTASLKITAPTDYHLRIGDWIWATHSTFGLFKVRIQRLKKTPGQMTIQAGKRLFTASDIFGEYLRAEIPDDADVLSETTLTDPTDGEFTIKKEDVDDALIVYFEASFSVDDDASTLDTGTFCDVLVNGKVVPPGRIVLREGGSVKVDITEQCSMSASVDTANTIACNLYRATGWSCNSATVSQWKGMKFLAA